MTTPEIEKLFPGISALPTSFILDRESRVVQKHVGMLTARTTEYETRHLAGLPVNASIEEIDQTQGLKLGNGAQAMTIPGVDLASLPVAKRTEALQKLNAQSCTCGCDLTVARCRVDDPTLRRQPPARAARSSSRSPARRERRRGSRSPPRSSRWCSLVGRRAQAGSGGQTRVRPGSDPDYVGSAACQRCHADDLRALVEDAHGQRRPRSEDAPRRDHPRPEQARSARHLHEGRHRVRLRQQVEAALLHARSATTTSRSARSGTSRTSGGALLRRRQHRLVGAALSGRQREAADRPALRRLPLGQLQRRRRSRSPSGTSAARSATARPRARRAAGAREHLQPGARRSGARQRHLHPVPLAGPAADQPDRGPLLRLAGRLPRRPEPERLLEARGAQARQDDVHAFRRRHGAQEPDAGQRFRAEPDVHARRHLRELPRRARHRATTPTCVRPAATVCLQCHGAGSPNGPHTTTIEQHTHHKAGSPAASASRATCRRSRRRSAT